MSALAIPSPVEKVKPRFRGVSHVIAFGSAVAASVALILSPRASTAYVGGLIYAGSVALMFGVSALYHKPMWGYRARRVLRRLDHAGIFFLIVGSFTAFWTLAPSTMRSPTQLWLMWIAAICGAVTLSTWTDMPRMLRAGSYVALGLSSIPLVVRLPEIIGWPRTGWVMAGSAIYILGATVYARRWPNPNPRVFGYHEVFHAMVILAAAIQFAVIVDLHWSV